MTQPAPAGTGVEPSIVRCFHCGAACTTGIVKAESHAFCCHGCLTVYDILTHSGLGHFYDLGRQSGIQVRQAARREQYAHLDDPAVRERLLDFADGQTARITFHIPSIHCIACVWLLENLFKLHPGIAASRVNFPRKEVMITFSPAQVALSELAALLAGIGYEPQFRLADMEPRSEASPRRKLYLQVGVAGFAFGNVMLFSFPSYFGLGGPDAGGLKLLFGGFSLAVALPSLIYSAGDYWRSAWLALRQKVLTIDLPIAAGLIALYAQSAFEIISRTGEGYLDSLTGLIFFLLCGKVFQQKTYDRLAFDRDFKSFFPLSVMRRTAQGETSAPLASIQVGDHLVLRNHELIPADARLVSGPALIDYSFITGESAPVEKHAGDYLYAGGQQLGGAIEVQVEKPVSQSYLASLWSHETFAKPRLDWLNTLTNQFSRRFILIVATVALGSALYWSFINPPVAIKAFVSVLIVACPCALALAAPFALGTAQRLLAREGVFLKNQSVIERLARIQNIVLDKTGTLTVASGGHVKFNGRNGKELTAAEQTALRALVKRSTHPLSLRLSAALVDDGTEAALSAFEEVPGQGLAGVVNGLPLVVGNSSWLRVRGIDLPADEAAAGNQVQVAIQGRARGCFSIETTLRPQVREMIRQLGARHELALLSGDNERERERFQELFGNNARLHFNHDPLRKLELVEQMQRAGRSVMMVGDGLNDAGALKQSDVGVAVIEEVGRFSPASDVILEARLVPRLAEILDFSRGTVRIVWLSFLLSSVYNAVGLTIAARGMLSPLVCAILMPLSSITVVTFACLAPRWLGRRLRQGRAEHTRGGAA